MDKQSLSTAATLYSFPLNRVVRGKEKELSLQKPGKVPVLVLTMGPRESHFVI